MCYKTGGRNPPAFPFYRQGAARELLQGHEGYGRCGKTHPSKGCELSSQIPRFPLNWLNKMLLAFFTLPPHPRLMVEKQSCLLMVVGLGDWQTDLGLSDCYLLIEWTWANYLVSFGLNFLSYILSKAHNVPFLGEFSTMADPGWASINKTLK